jgi:hypothetical protein
LHPLSTVFIFYSFTIIPLKRYDGNPELVERICHNAQRYIRLIESAADTLLAAMEPTVDLSGTVTSLLRV